MHLWLGRFVCSCSNVRVQNLILIRFLLNIYRVHDQIDGANMNISFVCMCDHTLYLFWGCECCFFPFFFFVLLLFTLISVQMLYIILALSVCYCHCCCHFCSNVFHQFGWHLHSTCRESMWLIMMMLLFWLALARTEHILQMRNWKWFCWFYFRNEYSFWLDYNIA